MGVNCRGVPPTADEPSGVLGRNGELPKGPAGIERDIVVVLPNRTWPRFQATPTHFIR